jgi:DNA-binding LacI/PurR family transcriptional regulator
VSKKPTSSDVARAAGVSRATVSYVLNGRSDVRITEATRMQVLKAARDLGYHPSPAARALRAGHGEVVLVLLPEWGSGEFGELLAEVGRLVGNHGLVCLRHEGAQWQGSLGRLLGRVTAAAVITLEPLSQADATALERTGIPEIKMWPVGGPGELPTLAIDQVEIVRVQVDHLLDQGYRRLAYLALPDAHAQPFLEVRIKAFGAVCASRGISSAPVAIEPQDLEPVIARLRTWRGRSSKPLGICTWSDLTGIAVLNAARALDLDVPGDVGVIGVDGTLGARLAQPALSSVALNLPQEAALVAHNVAAALGLGEGEPPFPSDPLTLLPRSSTRLSDL